MGRDKAMLTLPGTDTLLWQRQWKLLTDLQPRDMLWSGFPRSGLPTGCRAVSDVSSNAGPLAGIGACLDFITTDLLLVLAIDLPRMNGEFLRRLLGRCSAQRGAVGQRAAFFEPLAAVYPKSLALLAREHLAQGRYALQDFVLGAIDQRALEVIPIAAQDEPLFQNLNTPSDLEELSSSQPAGRIASVEATPSRRP